MNILNVTTEELKNRIAGVKTLILPVGSFEQHSRFMCMGTDTVIATFLAQRVEQNTKSVALFPVVYGVSEIHKSFCGTIYISPKIFYLYIKDIITSVAKEQIENLLIINGHGANWYAINKACEECASLFQHIEVYQWWEMIGEKFFTKDEISHAGAQELSVLQYIDMQCVRLDKVEDQESGDININLFECKDIYQITKNGVLGKARTHDVEKGKCVIDEVVKMFVTIIETWEKNNGDN